MFSYIEKLRKESLEKRKQAALTLTAIFLGVVVVLWLVVSSVRSYLLSHQSADTPREVNGIVAPY